MCQRSHNLPKFYEWDLYTTVVSMDLGTIWDRVCAKLYDLKRLFNYSQLTELGLTWLGLRCKLWMNCLDTGLTLIWLCVNSRLGLRSSFFIHTHDLRIWLFMGHQISDSSSDLSVDFLVFINGWANSIVYSLSRLPSIMHSHGEECTSLFTHGFFFEHFVRRYESSWKKYFEYESYLFFCILTFQRKAV